MKTISLKIDVSIFGDTEKLLALIQKPRSRYINEALDNYNRLQKRLLIEKQLIKESKIVEDESMAVLKEFERLDDEG